MNTLIPENNREVLSSLRAVSQEMLNEIKDLTEHEVSFSPAKGQWSIKEIICHLHDADEIFHHRLVQMLEEDEPFLRAFNPDELATEHDYPSFNWTEAQKTFQQARQANLDLLAGLNPVQWFRGGIHQERGHIVVQDVAESLSEHTREHIAQIRQIKASYK
jgi:hypothetical protein